MPRNYVDRDKIALERLNAAIRAFNSTPRQITIDEFDAITQEANDILFMHRIK